MIIPARSFLMIIKLDWKILIGVSDDDPTWILPGIVNDNLQRKFKPAMVLMTGMQKKRCSVLANPPHLRVC